MDIIDSHRGQFPGCAMCQGVGGRGGHVVAKDAGIIGAIASTVAAIAVDARRKILLRGVLGQILDRKRVIMAMSGVPNPHDDTHPAS